MGHFFTKFPPFPGVWVAVGPQKSGNHPAGHPPGEIAALFGPYCHLDPLKRGELPEKVPQKGAPPILGTFWRFLGFPGENGVPDRSPKECKPAEKTVHHPSVVIWSDDPRGVVYHFLCWLAFPGRPVWHTVFTGKSPKSPKSAQNRGCPLLGHFFRKFPPFQGV